MKQLEKLHGASAPPLYETFVKLNKLWEQYILTLLGKDDPLNPAHMASICSKVVKADLAGADIKVVNAKNPTLLGVGGIVMRESVRCLFVIAPDNTVKNLVKAGTVFEVRLPHCNIRVWGDNIIHLGSERTKVKFKERYQLELY